MNVKVGDTVLYKESEDVPPRSSVHIHPAIVTLIADDLCDLTVFFHNWNAEPVNSVPLGDEKTDGNCWWPREETAEKSRG